jgi:pimeloyl-ACP methyl ester carboxylesterase
MSSDLKGSYAPVNGLEMYHEIHGMGEPLILLHGGFGATGMFGDLLPSLSGGRQVIAADLQAHGRTADIDRPLSSESMADDVAALIRHLGLERADVMGYSMGWGSPARQPSGTRSGAQARGRLVPLQARRVVPPRSARPWGRWARRPRSR